MPKKKKRFFKEKDIKRVERKRAGQMLMLNVLPKMPKKNQVCKQDTCCRYPAVDQNLDLND
jgi:hypothetical protein